MNYELQVHALTPVRPTVAEILAKAEETGIALEVGDGPREPAQDRSWTSLTLRAAGHESGGFTVEVFPEPERIREQFRAERAAGDEVPDQVFDAACVYVLTLEADVDDDEDEMQQAAFVVGTWALATCGEGLVFDPQEDLFADAESFWGLVMLDEDELDEVTRDRSDDEDDPSDDDLDDEDDDGEDDGDLDDDDDADDDEAEDAEANGPRTQRLAPAAGRPHPANNSRVSPPQERA